MAVAALLVLTAMAAEGGKEPPPGGRSRNPAGTPPRLKLKIVRFRP